MLSLREETSTMRRYFFDVISGQYSNYDYCGRNFPTPESAYELAELMALDLAVDTEDEHVGRSVNVTTADGRKLFSVPVQPCCLAAP
jgi:hypothetical protein